MMTGTYYPKDYPASERLNQLYSVCWSKGDKTVYRQMAAWNEGPSYCVRLLVFDYEDCLK